MGGKNENNGVASPESVPFHLKLYGYTQVFPQFLQWEIAYGFMFASLDIIALPKYPKVLKY